MELSEARQLKVSVRAEAARALLSTASALVMADGDAETMEAVPDWEGVAVGLTALHDGRAHLAVRATSVRMLELEPVARLIDERPDQVDVEITGEVVAHQHPYEGAVDPLQAGYSVGHRSITAGTLGAFVTGEDGTRLILSNNHVLAAVDAAAIGDDIVQPGPLDGGSAARKVASLTDFVRLDLNGPNLVDAAIAELASTADLTLDTREGLSPNGWLGIDDVDDGLGVTKVGRTTGVTEGFISAIELDGISVNYGQGRTLVFDDQLEIKPHGDVAFSAGGDSGSLVVTSGPEPMAVGLLFAGSSYQGAHRTFANPIETVLGTLGVELMTRTPAP